MINNTINAVAGHLDACQMLHYRPINAMTNVMDARSVVVHNF